MIYIENRLGISPWIRCKARDKEVWKDRDRQKVFRNLKCKKRIDS